MKEDVSQYSLGESFTIFNVKEKTHSTCFPVLCNSKMVAILEVNKVGREYTSTLSQSFAKELEKRLLDNEKKSFVLITDGVHLQAFEELISMKYTNYMMMDKSQLIYQRIWISICQNFQNI